MSDPKNNYYKSNAKHNEPWAGFSLIRAEMIWEKELLPFLQHDPNIRKLYQSVMSGWIEACRGRNPEFWPSIELPYDIDRHPAPWELGFFIDDTDIRPDPLNPPELSQVSHWYPFQSWVHLSKFSLELCKAWWPDGEWLVVNSDYHSVVIDLKNRLIFSPEYHAKHNAKYILELSIIGDLNDGAESDRASNVVSWFEYHLHPHSRPKLPRVIENALQYDLLDYLQIMAIFSKTEVPNFIKPNPPISTCNRVMQSGVYPAIVNSEGGQDNG